MFNNVQHKFPVVNCLSQFYTQESYMGPVPHTIFKLLVNRVESVKWRRTAAAHDILYCWILGTGSQAAQLEQPG